MISVGSKKRTPARPSVGARIVRGLEDAIAWSQGDKRRARPTVVLVPEIDIRGVRERMGLSQSQFAAKFGFSAATLRNWEQGRSRPDTPARLLLAVIAKHPDAVEDVLAN